MYRYLVFVVSGAIISWLFPWGSSSPSCRCRPWEPCWPSEEEWNTFNTSIDGNLIRVKPIGHVCHEPAFNQSVCNDLSRLARDSGWRASQPGALQDWVWEGGSIPNETCQVVSPRHLPCNQGRLSIYSALVKSTQQIREVVRFAHTYSLRLVIRNTGHDTSGRSSSPGSLQIHTHHLKNIEYHDNFLPSGAVTPLGPAVTVGAGVLLGELYAKGASEGYTVVGGECPTVGAAGGFLQGGGVSSFLSQKRGLAVDNVLEFQIVTANGDLVIANQNQNHDLFWALKGGGGGTFGVVTQVTMRAYPDIPTVVASIYISASPTNDDSFWAHGVTTLLSALQSFNREDIAGQFLLIPQPEGKMKAGIGLYFEGITDTTGVEEGLSPFLNALNTSGMTYEFSSKSLPRVSDDFRKGPDIYPENYGILSGTVLVSHKTFNSSEGPLRMAKNFSLLPMVHGDILFTSNLGGRVNANKNTIDIPMHPAWRSAAQLVNFIRAVEPSAEGKLSARYELTHVQMPHLYALEPDLSVSYFNLADPDEPNPRQVFWGENNYGHLSDIKQKWDKDGLFITRLGVGSEHWDQEGMCRKKHGMIYRLPAFFQDVYRGKVL